MSATETDLEAARQFLACSMSISEMQANPALAQILSTVANAQLAKKARPARPLPTPRAAPDFDAKRRASNDNDER